MAKKPRNNSYRLRGYDYSQPGAYFVTICVDGQKHLFGEIMDNQMQLNDAGIFAQCCWQQIPKHFPAVGLDEFVIMPNHVHGIIVINPDHAPTVGVQNFEPLQNTITQCNNTKRLAGYQRVIPGSLGAIIRAYKSTVTRWFRANTPTKTLWQRNFYDHIVRDEMELDRIRSYIRKNPANWRFDRQNCEYAATVGESNGQYGHEIWMI